MDLYVHNPTHPTAENKSPPSNKCVLLVMQPCSCCFWHTDGSMVGHLSTISMAWKPTLWWSRSIRRQPNRYSVIPTCPFPSTDSAILLVSCLTYTRSTIGMESYAVVLVTRLCRLLQNHIIGASEASPLMTPKPHFRPDICRYIQCKLQYTALM